jgi:hypothetical protein
MNTPGTSPLNRWLRDIVPETCSMRPQTCRRAKSIRRHWPWHQVREARRAIPFVKTSCETKKPLNLLLQVFCYLQPRSFLDNTLTSLTLQLRKQRLRQFSSLDLGWLDQRKDLSQNLSKSWGFSTISQRPIKKVWGREMYGSKFLSKHLASQNKRLHFSFFLFLFIYSHVHTLFGSFLPPAPTPTLSPRLHFSSIPCN